MEKESDGAAGRDVVIGFGGLVENGEDGVHGFRKSFGWVGGSEKDIGAGMIKIEAGEAKLWGWELWLGMWTTTGIPAAGLIGRAL